MGAGGIGLILAVPVGFAGWEVAKKVAHLVANNVPEEHHATALNLGPGQSASIGDRTIEVP